MAHENLKDTSSDSSDADMALVKENNTSPIDLVKADIRAMPHVDKVKMICVKVGEEDTISITMKDVSFYYTLNAVKGKRLHYISHSKIWTNLQTNGKWYKVGWRKVSTQVDEKIVIKQENGTVASRSSSEDNEEQDDGEPLS